VFHFAVFIVVTVFGERGPRKQGERFCRPHLAGPPYGIGPSTPFESKRFGFPLEASSRCRSMAFEKRATWRLSARFAGSPVANKLGEGGIGTQSISSWE